MPGPSVRAFLVKVRPLVEDGDRALTRLGEGPALAESFALLEARTHRSLWNMQANVRLSMQRLTQPLDTATRSRGIEERLVYSPRAARLQPLLTSFDPELRIAAVPTALIVTDERYAVVEGSERTGDQGSAWGTEDPDLVALAAAAFLEVWDQSITWEEAGLRPPLPERRFRVAVLLVDGCTDREIAVELGISARTVSDEVRAIVDWLGARSRTHAVAMLVGAA